MIAFSLHYPFKLKATPLCFSGKNTHRWLTTVYNDWNDMIYFHIRMDLNKMKSINILHLSSKRVGKMFHEGLRVLGWVWNVTQWWKALGSISVSLYPAITFKWIQRGCFFFFFYEANSRFNPHWQKMADLDIKVKYKQQGIRRQTLKQNYS